MVVSKEKRKRKSPQPTATVESSPEMPKRTKVQAQRKFAQGQSAPAYNPIIAASSSSNTGPSTSSESREPPTEILPNKRPKTEDFLTFLCFRGTSALPAHLDFLNQGKSKEHESPIKKTVTKVVKPAKKGKKGRPPKANNAKNAKSNEDAASDAKVIENENKQREIIEVPNNEIEPKTKDVDKNVIPFAVRKRAEVVSDGNRRSRGNERQLRNVTEIEKCNSPTEGKRRSNRTNAKDSKPLAEGETDEEEESLSVLEDVGKNEEKVAIKNTTAKSDVKTPKTPILSQERNSETPSKDSDTGKSRKGRTSAAAMKNRENAVEDDKPKCAEKIDEKPLKDKAPVKRPRQKESPIFIPSPEPSGRMTRQRAFFEPVKVIHRDDSVENKVEMNAVNEVEVESEIADEENKKVNTATGKVLQATKIENEIIIDKKIVNDDKQLEKDKSKSDLNVFDFSSDDEQPLAKAIKLKKGSPRKSKAGNKTMKKVTPKKSIDKQQDVKELPKVECKTAKVVNDLIKDVKDIKDGKEIKAKHELKEIKLKPDIKEVNEPKAKKDVNENKDNKREDIPAELKTTKGKRGRAPGKKNVEENNKEDDDNKSQGPSSPKKLANAKQGRKKIVHSEDEHETQSVTAKNQRPSRKTKEAATIYMGIIGHKLQQADDEDDDLSLNSFPDLPNVKEMEKMELELKKHVAKSTSSAKTTASSPTFLKSTPKPATKSTPTPTPKPVSAAKSTPTPKATPTPTPKSTSTPAPTPKLKTSPVRAEKATPGRRGRPPKQSKQLPVKREIEGMLVKKGVIAKLTTAKLEDTQSKEKSVTNKDESDDEDFLLNEEVNETKRKLEKSFSDSDDEPLAIKAHVKTSDKDVEQDIRKPEHVTQQITPTLTMLPLTTKAVPTPPPLSAFNTSNVSPITGPAQMTSQTPPSPFKTIEKKSPIPTSKILNVPATYAIPGSGSVNLALNATFNKTTSYLPQASPHYHASHVRPPAHQFPTAKSPTAPVPMSTSHLTAPLPPQSPLKYQAPPPTTYPPPIEAYPSPKINPNFLTPKFDRTTLPRTNNFPSPSPMKFDMSSTTKTMIGANSTLSPKTPTLSASGSAAATGNNTVLNSSSAATNSNDPLKDEIGSILAANLMPSKEESGKIFGIASVSLAQSSGPDNTKCTLGKCGSIHKPVLGPVVPTEVYIGDQLSSKERRKAKVNMTHEQIQKWLIECSSNPDEIQDDLDDDFDDNLRPNLFANTPPPTRDDKESTSFSSSSKATRDLGKSESAWSAKGPSLKATPVVATSSRKDDLKHLEPTSQLDIGTENDKISGQAINLSHKANVKQNLLPVDAPPKAPKEKPEKKTDKKIKEDKTTNKESIGKDNKQHKIDKEKEERATTSSTKMTVAGKQSNSTGVGRIQSPIETPIVTNKQNKKKNAATATSINADDKGGTTNIQKTTGTNAAANINATSGTPKTPKRTPVYNQKAQKQAELKEAAVSSHKKTAYGAFSADNEKSIYSFDKDDDDHGATKSISKPAFRRQSRRDSVNDETTSPNNNAAPTTRISPNKKRAAAAAAEKANKEIANASQNSSVSLTLSPSEKNKFVKVSLDAEKPVNTKATSAGKAVKGNKKEAASATATANNKNDADSDSEGHTFYIPLQNSGTGVDGEGGIQGVAVKLGREGPEGPNQKVIMHATLVTKAQMGSNSKPLPDSMNASDILKTLMSTTSSNATASVETSKKAVNSSATASTSAAAAAATNSASNSLKNVPIGTVQPRFKASETAVVAVASSQAQPTPATASGSSNLVRVNSNSSLFSGSAKSRVGGPVSSAIGISTKKFRDDTPIKMSNNTAFPRHDDPTQMVEAPIFRPTEKEFADPIEFIERITPIAARFGICKIIPPANFKPECRISDEMRFTAYNQYVHKMLHRWGPSAKEFSAIKKYLATQSIVMNHPPWIGGMEVDLPRLYHTVQELGGLKEVIEKKKWARVAEEMCIPKLAQDRVTKLDDIYCKYLLPYDTLSPAERQKLFDEVEADWAKREARARRNADRFVNTESVSNEEDDVSSDEEDSEEEVDGVSMECIVKGRSMPLSQFYRIARNTMALWFKNTEPTVNEVEAEFWRHVAVRDSHVCVHSGSIDSSGWGYGFPSPGPKGKGSNYARHPWNLKVLTNNAGSVLRSLGPVMGVTVPTLHVGMLFSACCWYRDPHGLSWIEYLHTGASKLWYGIPDDQSANFRSALTSLIPTHCQNKTIWLPCDTVMVPPHMLTDRGVSLCRIEQKPGEFIVVFPRAYTSSLATGYVVSESVYFATTSWLDLAKDDFRDIHDSCEPAMFSLEQLLFALGYDQRVTTDTLQQMLPMLREVIEKETAAREQLKAAGVTASEKVSSEKGQKSKKQQPPIKSIESECDLCRANLYISMVKTEEGNIYCLQHALKNLNNGNIQAKQCKLIYAYNIEDIESFIKNLKEKIQQKRNVLVNKKSK